MYYLNAQPKNLMRDLGPTILAGLWDNIGGRIDERKHTDYLKVLKVYPEHEKENVSIYTNLRMEFNQSINPETVNGNSIILLENNQPIPCEYTVQENEIQIHPKSVLKYGLRYEWEIAQTLQSKEGLQLEKLEIYSFLTETNASPPPIEPPPQPISNRPKLISTFPLQNTPGTSTRRGIRLEFDRPILASTVHSGTVEVFQAGVLVPGNWEVRGNTVLFTPNSPFLEKSLYSVKIHSSVSDLEGNTLDGTKEFSFQTGIQMQLDSRRSHTCALLPDGSVRCWGANRRGQLGFEGGINLGDMKQTKKLIFSERGIQIAVGDEHSCVLLETGQPKCWGRGSEGQLGNGGFLDTKEASLALNIPLPERTKRIAAGRDVTCSILDSGKFLCWGNSEKGILGWTIAGAIPPVVLNPILEGMSITMPNRVNDISIGEESACALLENGNMRCWGRYFDPFSGSIALYEANNGTFVNPVSPILSMSHLPYGSLSNRNIVLFQTGEVGEVRWYENRYDNWGIIGSVQKVKAGYNDTCALLQNGKLKCWKDTGIGSENYQLYEFQKPAIDVTLGEFHSCVLLEDEGIVCWGSNQEGQLGYGTELNVPVDRAEIFYLE
jgi:alpha-tubulin suppressor-like RCC1 family protein